MKNYSHKIVSTIIFVLVTTFSIYAGEGQCPIVPPPPPPVGNGLVNQIDNATKDSTQPQTNPGDAVKTDAIQDYIRELIKIFSRFSL